MTIMQVLTVQEYHAVMLDRYNQRVKEYDYTKGGFPNIAFYLFYDEQGNERKDGFVATDSIFNAACWGKTKSSAIRKFKSFVPSFSISK